MHTHTICGGEWGWQSANRRRREKKKCDTTWARMPNVVTPSFLRQELHQTHPQYTMASSSFDDALASTRRLLTDLAALRSQLLLSTTTGSNAAAHQSLNSIVDDLAAIARSGADSAADVDGEVLQHLSRPEGSHPDLLLLSKLGDAMMVWRQQAASTTGAAEATGDAPPPAAAVRDWLEREGLASAAARIFEREDDGSGDVEVDTDAVDCERPRDLPSSHVQLLRGAISDVALREVLLAAAENHSALSAAAVALGS